MRIEPVLSSPAWVLLPGLIGLILLAVWVYRHTLPPVSVFLRRTLMVLRASVFLWILLLLARPVLRISRDAVIKARVAVLLDVSGSMQAGGRGRDMEALLRSDPFRSFTGRTDARLFLFSDSLRPLRALPDSFSYGGPTDLSLALDRFQSDPPEGILIFSDGIANTGRNPARAAGGLNCPVFTVTIGSAAERPDVLVSGVLANGQVYAGSECPVRVSLRGPGFGGAAVELSLGSGGAVLDRKTVTLPPGGMEQSIDMRYRMETPGLRRLTVSLKPLPGEATDRNNVLEFGVEVLKSKLRAFLCAEAPSPDLAFLKRVLAADPDVSVEVRTLKSGAEFYEGNFPGSRELADTDVFFLVDVPNRFFPSALWQRLADTIARTPKPFFLVAGPELDLRLVQPLAPAMPVRLGERRTERPVLAVFTGEGKNHPLFQAENPEEAESWDLPPLFSSWRTASPEPGGRVLAETLPEKPGTDVEGRTPLVAIRSVAGRKAIVVLARGLYRWDLTVRARGPSVFFRSWIRQSVRWLAAREGSRQVRLSAGRRICRAGEENTLSSQVYDETGRPLSGADVRVRFLQPAGVRDLVLADAGNGLYQSMFRPSAPGLYRAEAGASFQERTVGRDTTEFAVSAFDPEFLDTRARPDVMEAVARAAGGRSGPPDSLEAILGAMRLPEKSIVRTTEWELGFQPPVLAVVLCLLSAEWFIRRRKGMV